MTPVNKSKSLKAQHCVLNAKICILLHCEQLTDFEGLKVMCQQMQVHVMPLLREFFIETVPTII